MRHHIARPPSLAFLRRLFACCLLLTSVVLPLQAWAVDTDGDGVDDSIDAFPNNAEATTDTDGDGMPDSLDLTKLPIIFSDTFTGGARPEWNKIQTSGNTGWFYQNNRIEVKNFIGLGGGFRYISLTVSIPAGGATLTFAGGKTGTGNTGSSLNGLRCTQPCYFPDKTLNLSAGSQTITWGVVCPYTTCGYIDDVLITKASSLTEDLDDDNDGVVDYLDPEPLNASNSALWPLNGNYKGSAIRESQTVQ